MSLKVSIVRVCNLFSLRFGLEYLIKAFAPSGEAWKHRCGYSFFHRLSLQASIA
ncbi:MAG: hypothetical protein WA882_06865 [Geitlerinemataceae cyanobacterium]